MLWPIRGLWEGIPGSSVLSCLGETHFCFRVFLPIVLGNMSMKEKEMFGVDKGCVCGWGR